MAERVGFEPVRGVENKELTGSSLPHDPLEPHECRGRDTYWARGARRHAESQNSTAPRRRPHRREPVVRTRWTDRRPAPLGV